MKQFVFWIFLILIGVVLENCRADAARVYKESKQPFEPVQVQAKPPLKSIAIKKEKPSQKSQGN